MPIRAFLDLLSFPGHPTLLPSHLLSQGCPPAPSYQSTFIIKEGDPLLGGGGTTSATSFKVPRFEPDLDLSFPDYLQRYSEAIFNRWAHRIALLTDKIVRDKIKYEASRSQSPTKKPSLIRERGRPSPMGTLFQGTQDTMILLNQPISQRRRTEIMGELSRLWVDRDDKDIWFAGNVPSGHPSGYLRKVYLNPHLEAIAPFVQTLYKIIEEEGIRIFNSKIHREAFQRVNPTTPGSQGDIVGQAHNTYCIYLPNDDDVTRLLHAIQRAERSLKAPLLLAQKEESYPKGIQALGGKAILGLDLPGHNQSFDNWTGSLVAEAYQAVMSCLEVNPKISFDETLQVAREAMILGLRKARRDIAGPEQYLSFPYG